MSDSLRLIYCSIHNIEFFIFLMTTRSTDSLLESPGQEHLSIKGTRLPTHNQVLLCHLSHIENFQSEDNTRQNYYSVPSARATFEQVKIHYIKANTENVIRTAMYF